MPQKKNPDKEHQQSWIHSLRRFSDAAFRRAQILLQQLQRAIPFLAVADQRKKAATIKQHDFTDCGAACLASVSAYYGLHLPIAKIRQMAFTDQKGTNMLGMLEAAKKIGYSAKAVKGAYENLESIPYPAVAHVIVDQRLHHYVVLYGISDKGLKLWTLQRER